MITCTPDPESGTIFVAGTTPNGTGLITRTQPGAAPLILRGGAAQILTGGFALDDTEAPLGVPVQYVATISAITSTDRLVQQNLIRTPHFVRGVGSWTAGTGRTLTTGADSTAHQATVGLVTANASTTTPSAPPTLTGWKNSAVGVSGSYTLDPATPTGGAAIATNDQMVIIHSQVSTVAAPTTPSGWTILDDVTANGYRQIVYTRTRQAGDTSYVVAAPASANSVGSLLWVRGAGTGTTVAVTATAGNAATQLSTNPHVAIRPALIVNSFTSLGGAYGPAAGLTATATIRPTGAVSSTPSTVRFGNALITASGSVSGQPAGAAFAYAITASGSTRSLIVGTYSQTEAQETTVATVTYASPLTMGFATQIAFQVSDVLTNRIVAATKAALIPATTAAAPHLLTGRFKYVHAGLRNWLDVRNIGTWQNVKDTNATWLAVRGSGSTTSGVFTKLFLTIVDPGTGSNYIPPQQVRVGMEAAMNTWLDFSALIVNTADIPTTAEIRLVHGSALKEFAVTWSFDEFGLTPGTQRAAHDTLYWFSGDSAVPSNHAARLAGPGWVGISGDAAITWVGTAGNSTSEFRAASTVQSTTTCQLDPPALDACEPVLLSDPVNVSFGVWVNLIDIGDLSRESRRGLYPVLDSRFPVAVSQARAAESTTLVVETATLADRDRMNVLLDSGRVLLLRNPDPTYPENNWYLSVGTTKERRPIPDARYPERLWSLPVDRVERPTGLIEVSGGRTWADVLAEGTWANVLADNTNWLDVLDQG